MRRNLTAREVWSVYGLWFTVFVVLAACLTDWASSAGSEAIWPLRAVCATWSIATLFQIVCRSFTLTRHYEPYLVKWLSWFIANCVASFLAFGLIWVITIALLFGIPSCLAASGVLMIFVLPLPVARLYVHIREDLQNIRRSATLSATA